MQFTFKVGENIKKAWALYKENFSLITMLVLVTFGLQMLSQSVTKHNPNILFSFGMTLVSIIISYMWIKSIMNLLDGKGFNPFTKESLPNLAQYWDFIKTNILVALCVIPGIILLIVPGLYIIGRLFPAMYISVEKHQGARMTVSEAWEITKGSGWKLLGKSLLVGLFIIAGFIALFIGSFITYPVGMIVLVMMYREFKKFKSNEIIYPKETVIVETKTEVKEEVPEVKENVSPEVKETTEASQ